jgi:hypothetical protein
MALIKHLLGLLREERRHQEGDAGVDVFINVIIKLK